MGADSVPKKLGSGELVAQAVNTTISTNVKAGDYLAIVLTTSLSVESTQKQCKIEDSSNTYFDGRANTNFWKVSSPLDANSNYSVINFTVPKDDTLTVSFSGGQYQPAGICFVFAL